MTTTSTLIPMVPAGTEPFVGQHADGQPIYCVTYRLPAECSTAIGWGCTIGHNGRFDVPVSMGHPHVEVFDDLRDGGGAYIAQAHKVRYIR